MFKRSMLTVAVSAVLATSVALAPGAHADGGAVSATRVAAAAGAGQLDFPLPPGWQARQDAAAARVGIDISPAADSVQRALNPDDYECEVSPRDGYVRDLIAELSASDRQFVFTSGVLNFPAQEALLFGSDADPRYELRRGFRNELQHSFRDAKRFWDVPSQDIQLHAMNGSVLLDPARLTRLLVELYELPPAEATAYATAVATRIAESPAFDGGNWPLFTLNAWAFSRVATSHPLFATVPDKIVFGDGLLTALEDFDFRDVGPRMILAHEFGHHIQFERGLFDGHEDSPEATRRTELMADALSTYFGTHPRGLSLNTPRAVQAETLSFAGGDCDFDSSGHHGTPNQRQEAAAWGAALGNDADHARILPSATVIELFDAALPAIVAPDA